MKKVTRDILYCEHSRYNEPSLAVEPGETFVAETEFYSAGWLNSIGDQWMKEKGPRPNPTVCIAVKGARPGDALAVIVEDIRPDELGYTG